MKLSSHAKNRLRERGIDKKYVPCILKLGTPKPNTRKTARIETKNFGVIADIRRGVVVTVYRI